LRGDRQSLAVDPGFEDRKVAELEADLIGVLEHRCPGQLQRRPVALHLGDGDPALLQRLREESRTRTQGETLRVLLTMSGTIDHPTLPGYQPVTAS